MMNSCRASMFFFVAVASLMSVGATRVNSASIPLREHPPNEAYTLEFLWWPQYCHDNPQLRYCAGASFHGFVLGAYIPRSANLQVRTCEAHVTEFMPDDKLLKVMPDEALLRTQWELYGTCSGVSQTDYFDRLSRISRAIKIPNKFVLPREHFSVSIEEVKQDFLRKNNHLPPDSLDVFCKSGLLSKIEIQASSQAIHSARSCELPSVLVIARLPLAE
jgi:ribonuclease I